MASPLLPDNITQARGEAETLTRTAGEFGAAMPSIKDTLKKQINTLYADNADVLGSFAQGVGNLVSAPNQANEMFGGVRDPFARQGLIAQFTGDQSVAPITYAGILGQRMGRIGDVVQSGANAFESEATARANAAQLAQQRYEQLLNEFQLTEDIRLKEQANATARAAAAATFRASTTGGSGQQQSGKPAVPLNVAQSYLNPGGVTKDKYIDENEYQAAFDRMMDSGYDPMSIKTSLDTLFAQFPDRYVPYKWGENTSRNSTGLSSSIFGGGTTSKTKIPGLLF